MKKTFMPLEAPTAIPDHSRYSNYIPNTGHTYGTITDTIDIKGQEGKAHIFNISEKYHIYRITKDDLHMNDIQPHI
jgi:hypothetical protein